MKRASSLSIAAFLYFIVLCTSCCCCRTVVEAAVKQQDRRRHVRRLHQDKTTSKGTGAKKRMEPDDGEDDGEDDADTMMEQDSDTEQDMEEDGMTADAEPRSGPLADVAANTGVLTLHNGGGRPMDRPRVEFGSIGLVPPTSSTPSNPDEQDMDEQDMDEQDNLVLDQPQLIPDRPEELPPLSLPFPDANDMGFRFNKIWFPDEGVHPDNAHLPLYANDYPIDASTASWLRSTNVHSLVTDDNCFKCVATMQELVDYVGGLPSYPSRDGSDEYWEELQHVTWVQLLRRAGTDPALLMPLPDLWEGYSAEQVAEAVHDEVPGTNHIPLFHGFFQDGAMVDPDIVPTYSDSEFLRGVVMLANVNTWAPDIVGPMNFGVKFYAGRPRPEEIAYMIATREITEDDGVPKELVDMVDDMHLTSPESYTAYPEGCPPHPSWPAMHSAASSASLWMTVVMNLTPEQECQTRLMDYAVAYARTVAGVHYESDNWAGLTIGQEVVARVLPDFLADRYGSDPDVVRAKIAAKRFDWTDFKHSNCALTGSV